MNKYRVTLRISGADGDIIEHYTVSADNTGMAKELAISSAALKHAGANPIIRMMFMEELYEIGI